MTDEAPGAAPREDADSAPAIDLGPGFAAIPFAAGKYSVAIGRKLHGTHSLQVLNEESAASLVLELGEDGTASACRGWRSSQRNSGPQVKTEERYREQQGYRGRHVIRDGVAELTLERDDSICAPLFEGNLALARAPKLELRCVLARATGQLAAVNPLLLCQPLGVTPTELELYSAPNLAPNGWLALGGGNGLLVRVTGRPAGARAGAEGAVTTALADQPIEGNAWEKTL